MRFGTGRGSMAPATVTVGAGDGGDRRSCNGGVSRARETPSCWAPQESWCRVCHVGGEVALPRARTRLDTRSHTRSHRKRGALRSRSPRAPSGLRDRRRKPVVPDPLPARTGGSWGAPGPANSPLRSCLHRRSQAGPSRRQAWSHWSPEGTDAPGDWEAPYSRPRAALLARLFRQIRDGRNAHARG